MLVEGMIVTFAAIAIHLPKVICHSVAHKILNPYAGGG